MWWIIYIYVPIKAHIAYALVVRMYDIFASAWGFQRCSFLLTGQCESLYSVERASGLAPRLFIYIANFHCFNAKPGVIGILFST